MKDDIELNLETMLELIRYAFLRLDGAWFIAAAEKFGVESATELDVKAWESFSERLGKRIATLANFQGDFIQDARKVLEIQHKTMKMNGEINVSGKNKLVLRVTDCEIWKMVSKVWTRETAPCHKVTQASIRGLLKGAFPRLNFEINHIKKIPLGDPCCEVEIIKKSE